MHENILLPIGTNEISQINESFDEISYFAQLRELIAIFHEKGAKRIAILTPIPLPTYNRNKYL